MVIDRKATLFDRGLEIAARLRGVLGVEGGDSGEGSEHVGVVSGARL